MCGNARVRVWCAWMLGWMLLMRMPISFQMREDVDVLLAAMLQDANMGAGALMYILRARVC